ncbi:hypothetical protein ES332_D10G043800v1, partial [Gossypium tomentosum]
LTTKTTNYPKFKKGEQAKLTDKHNTYKFKLSFILLASQPSKFVSDNNIKVCCSFHDLFSLLCGNIMGNLSRVCPVVHHQQFKLSNIVHNKFLKAIRKIVTVFL